MAQPIEQMSGEISTDPYGRVYIADDSTGEVKALYLDDQVLLLIVE